MVAKKRAKRRASNCRQKIAGEICPGKYQLTYDNNAPIYTCDSCGHQEFTRKKFYNEYLQLYRNKENWDRKTDQVSCIIGFFCYMYEGFYETKYVFVPKNPNPYGSKEVKDSWSLLSAFNGDAHEARKYLYWLFKRGINKNTTITHFGYTNTPGLIRKYNLYAKQKGILRRESKLPKSFMDWCNEYAPEIFTKFELTTMNDLGAMVNYVGCYGDEIFSDADERRVLSSAEKYGLIKNGKLNIG